MGKGSPRDGWAHLPLGGCRAGRPTLQFWVECRRYHPGRQVFAARRFALRLRRHGRQCMGLVQRLVRGQVLCQFTARESKRACVRAISCAAGWVVGRRWKRRASVEPLRVQPFDPVRLHWFPLRLLTLTLDSWSLECWILNPACGRQNLAQWQRAFPVDEKPGLPAGRRFFFERRSAPSPTVVFRWGGLGWGLRVLYDLPRQRNPLPATFFVAAPPSEDHRWGRRHSHPRAIRDRRPTQAMSISPGRPPARAARNRRGSQAINRLAKEQRPMNGAWARIAAPRALFSRIDPALS